MLLNTLLPINIETRERYGGPSVLMYYTHSCFCFIGLKPFGVGDAGIVQCVTHSGWEVAFLKFSALFQVECRPENPLISGCSEI
jgi:hypothetical protein